MRARGLMAAVAGAAVGVLLLVAGSGFAAHRYERFARAGAEKAGGWFSYGELQSRSVGRKGCGANDAGEPAIRVSRTDGVFLGSESGIANGSRVWRGLGSVGGGRASGCGLEYRGQPNAVIGVGLSGGDIDIALASARNARGNYNVYVASLNLGSINVATSADDGSTFSQRPVQRGLPVDDREWIAAYGAHTSLLSYHDVATNNIDVLRSDDDGAVYTQSARAIPDADYKAQNNQLGNLAIDHRNRPDRHGGFFAYQVFVAPSRPSGSANNKAYMAVSRDGGRSFIDRPIGCSTSKRSLDHNFPNVSVTPHGTVWAAWSDDRSISTAVSGDHGRTWSCSRPVSTGTRQAIFPWLAATSRGVDLVYYGSPTRTHQTFYVYFAQNLTGKARGWRRPRRLMSVHRGAVCETGANCMKGRQLLDDFGIDTDRKGYAHVAYSHDAPRLGSQGTYTGSAVQRRGTRVGQPNR